MLSRFEGTEGKRRLVESVKSQRLVENDEGLATSIAEKGELIEFSTGTQVAVQGATDNDIFFILDGEAGIFVNKRHVATRSARDSVGEMAMIDPSARRSATVSALNPLTVVKISEPNFRELIKDKATAWRAIAIVIAERLRQRERFHRPPNDVPILFVGSSVEGLHIAKRIQLSFKHDRTILIRPWTTPGVFGPGGIPVDALLKEVDACDFAAFIFGPDDKLFCRAQEYDVPRDNVIFELGLFMGRLNRDRSFIVKDQASDIKIPTDLLGVTPITYVVKPGEDISPSIDTICTELKQAIDNLGVR